VGRAAQGTFCIDEEQTIAYLQQHIILSARKFIQKQRKDSRTKKKTCFSKEQKERKMKSCKGDRCRYVIEGRSLEVMVQSALWYTAKSRDSIPKKIPNEMDCRANQGKYHCDM